jgi:hypothetical protein
MWQFMGFHYRQLVRHCEIFQKISIVAVCLVVLALIFSALSASIPAVDDFGRAASIVTYGIPQCMFREYVAWSGRFTAAAIEFILDSQIRIGFFYPLSLFCFFISVLLLDYYSIRSIFDTDRAYALGLAIAFEVVRWSLLSGPEQSFFWLVGAIDNYLSISVAAFVCAKTLRLVSDARRLSAPKIAALSAAAFFCSGFHELFGSFFVGCLSLIVLGVGKARRSFQPWTLIVLVAAILGLALVIAAPGNSVRMAQMPKDFDRVLAIRIAATTKVAPILMSWANWLVLACGAALFASCRRISIHATVARVIDPRRIAGLTVVSAATMFCIATLIQGHIESRTVDGILSVFLIGLFLCAGSIARSGYANGILNSLSGLKRTLLTVLFCAGLCSTANVGAAADNHLRVAAAFRRAYIVRLNLLESVRGRKDADIELAPLNPSSVFFFSDMTSNPRDYINRAVSDYFAVGDVIIGAENRIKFRNGSTRGR